ncbi:restriction endonuclease [Streptomyces sp. DSM 41634]|uniref:restriction endonuclease n=1 Tax=Streptomyces sp. DSM 41634 TaxID=3448656 RepID=UPI0040403ABE
MTRSVDRVTADPAWRVYEKAVAALISGKDPGVTVEHDQHLPGILSGRLRQIDVLVRTVVAGESITVVYECKHQRRPVGLATVEEFVAKLEDVGANQGVLFASSGYTEAAVRRLENTTLPRVNAYLYTVSSLAEPGIEELDWETMA